MEYKRVFMVQVCATDIETNQNTERFGSVY